MAYTLVTPVGSAHEGTANYPPVSVPDNVIDGAFYDTTNKTGVLLIGRNALNYGTAVAQNTLQMVSNFAGLNVPNDGIALQGQLWFKTDPPGTPGGASQNGVLYVRNTANTSGGIANWNRIVTVPSSQTGTIPVVNPTPGSEKDGDMLIQGSVIKIWAGGAYRQVFPAIYS